MNPLNSILLEVKVLSIPRETSSEMCKFLTEHRRNNGDCTFINILVENHKLADTCYTFLRAERHVRIVGRLGTYDGEPVIYAEHIEFLPESKPAPREVTQ